MGLNRDQIAKLTGCKNFVGKIKKFILKQSLFIVVLHAETVQPSLHLLPSASSSQRSIIPFACFRRMAAWAASASCSSSMHTPDGRMVLTEQCLKAPVPRFCEVVSAVCVVHSDVVNVPDAGRECWSSCSVFP